MSVGLTVYHNYYVTNMDCSRMEVLYLFVVTEDVDMFSGIGLIGGSKGNCIHHKYMHCQFGGGEKLCIASLSLDEVVEMFNK